LIWLSIAAAYLIGGLPFSYWLVRWQRPGSDLRLMGSGNPGATNAFRVGGRTIGLVTLVLDILKGLVAVELARVLGIEASLLGATALAAVVGHIAPVWLGFRGGKGVATATGGLASLAPGALAVAGMVFIVMLLATRIVAVSSIAAALTLPLAAWVLMSPGPDAGWSVIVWILLISLLVVARHRANLRRLLSGREARLGAELEDMWPRGEDR